MFFSCSFFLPNFLSVTFWKILLKWDSLSLFSKFLQTKWSNPTSCKIFSHNIPPSLPCWHTWGKFPLNQTFVRTFYIKSSYFNNLSCVEFHAFLCDPMIFRYTNYLHQSSHTLNPSPLLAQAGDHSNRTQQVYIDDHTSLWAKQCGVPSVTRISGTTERHCMCTPQRDNLSADRIKTTRKWGEIAFCGS